MCGTSSIRRHDWSRCPSVGCRSGPGPGPGLLRIQNATQQQKGLERKKEEKPSADLSESIQINKVLCLSRHISPHLDRIYTA
mmetsp:Transcript_1171/g.3022  ORF Transcript_1171/g.3022 Transcript_1171/m.3022 type:complete len:82 (+) Transcript_1171:470-715(+)